MNNNFLSGFLKASSLLFMILGFQACQPEDDFSKLTTPEWNPRFAVPLINTSFQIKEVLDSAGLGDVISMDEDSLLLIRFEQEIASIGMDSLVAFPIIPLIATSNNNKYKVAFPDGEKIRRLNMTAADMDIHLEIIETEDVEVTITIPSLKTGSTVYTKTVTINALGGLVNLLDFSEDLAGYTMDLSLDGTTSNTFAFNYTAKRVSDQAPVILSLFTGSITGIEYNYLEGFFGTRTLASLSDTIEFKLPDNGELDFAFDFSDPRLTIFTHNSCGIPVHLDFPVIVGINSSTSVELTGDLITNGVDINYPSTSQVGQIIDTEILINRDVSNLKDLLDIVPDQLGYEVDAIANILNDTNQINFISEGSSFDVDLLVELPLDGTFEGLGIQDTIPFPFDALDIFTEVTLKFVTENSMPVDLNLQLYFYDTTTGLLMDSLLDIDGPFLHSAVVNSEGVSIEPTLDETIIVAGTEKFSRIKGSNLAVIKVGVSSSTQAPDGVKFYAYNGLKIALGVIAGVKVTDLLTPKNE